MGSFSLSCGLSNVSIQSEDVAVMFLKKNEDYSLSKNMICSNEGSNCFFNPCSPLIFGEYDTYGNIENVVLDKSFDWTCKTLGINNTEEDFHQYIEKEWMEIPKDGIYITFFNKNIVCSAIEFQRKEDSLFNYHHQDWVFKTFSHIFELVETVEDRYKYIYKIKNSNKTISSDGKWIKIDNRNVFDTKSLVKIINNKDISNEILSHDVQTYFEYEYDKELEKSESFLHSLDFTIYKGIDFFRYNYIDKFKDSKSIKKEVCDTFLLSNFMYKCNRYFYPVFSGMQYNDLSSPLYLNKITKLEMNRIKKDRNL